MATQESAALALADSEVAASTGEQLLANAIAAGAQTIHLEPHEELAHVRYRIDGLLHDWGQLSHNALGTLVAHFKHRANLQPDEHRWAQEGNFTATIDGVKYVVTLSTLPLTHGEKALLQVFDTRLRAHSLEALGLWGETRRRLNQALASHQGLIVVSGAHQGGTSSTLRSILERINHPSASIASIEESQAPRVKGVHQLRVDRRRGVTTEQALRAALANDANIVLLENLHGRHVTSHALESAGHGHLLVAGLHTSSLPRALAQLQALSDEPFVLAHGLRAVLHQRLVRRLCDNCKIAAHPSAATLRRLTEQTNITVATLQKFMTEMAAHGHAPTSMQLFKANPEGCESCHHTGFRGQIGLFELLPVSDKIQRQLAGSADPLAIAHAALKEGMMPLVVDGFIKALCGLTSLDEVLQSSGKGL